MAKSKIMWYNKRTWAGLLCIVSLGIAYALALRALDTGSLGQYFITFVLIGFAINRFVHLFRVGRA